MMGRTARDTGRRFGARATGPARAPCCQTKEKQISAAQCSSTQVPRSSQTQRPPQKRPATPARSYVSAIPRKGLWNLNAATQGRPSRNRADPGLKDAIPLGWKKALPAHLAEPAISIPPISSRNHLNLNPPLLHLKIRIKIKKSEEIAQKYEMRPSQIHIFSSTRPSRIRHRRRIRSARSGACVTRIKVTFSSVFNSSRSRDSASEAARSSAPVGSSASNS